jgi:hypothetical protein
MIATGLVVLSLLGQGGGLVPSESTFVPATPRDSALEFKLGGYKPMIDSAPGMGANGPYNATFGSGAMLLGELEYDRQLWQELGSVAVGFSLGYAEKYGAASLADGSAAAERTALKVVPLKIMAVYRFDYAATKWNIPLVPYVKAGLAYTPWWITKGGNIEYVDGLRGAGGNWGYAAVLGLSLQLDFLDQRLARDFDSDMGVNHSYLFGEYVYQDVNSFGTAGPDLSSRHFMFGLTLEF